MSAAALDDAARPLRDRLVEAALAILADEGIEAVSLRAIARRAGVSHGAPLRHFKSFSDLLAEVAAHGFRLLEANLREAAEAAPAGAGSLERMRSLTGAYVHTAVDHAALFGLMFRPDMLDVENERFGHDSAAAFDRVVGSVRALQDVGWRSSEDTRLLAGIVWAHVHGLATLWASGAFLGPVPGADLDRAIALTADLTFPAEAPSAR